MKSKFIPSIAVVMLIGSAACESNSPTAPATSTPPPVATPPPPPAPAPPSDAVISLDGSFVCLDPFCDFALFELALENTGGVGANLNFIRVENRDRIPILELGADHFINTFGDNRLEAGEVSGFSLTAQLGFVVLVGYGDDNGNTGQAEYFPDLPR